jgi:hypothetical protein
MRVGTDGNPSPRTMTRSPSCSARREPPRLWIEPFAYAQLRSNMSDHQKSTVARSLPTNLPCG